MSRRSTILLISILIVLAAAVWLVAREATLVWAVNHAVERSDGRLSVTGVTGSLVYGPIGFDKLEYQNTGLQVSAEHGRVELSRWRLLARDLLVHRLDVGSVAFTRHPAEHTESAKLPEQLALPLRVTIDTLHVNRIALAPGVVTAGPLDASIQAQPDVWSAQVRSLQTAIGAANGQMRIATARPFALDGSLSLVQPEPAYDGKANITGTLERISVQLNAKAKDATAAANAIITPFAAGPIEHLDAAANNVDPRYFRPTAPSARLVMRLAADRAAKNEHMHGTLKLTNSTPGVWDDGRIPLAELKGTLQGSPSDLALNDLLLDFGAAGKLSGAGYLRGSRLDLALLTQRLDLRNLHSRLYPTQLAGSIRAKATGDEQRFSLRLTQQEGRIDLDAHLRNGELAIEKLSAVAAGGRLEARGKLSLVGERPFKFNGTVRNFDPARFGRFNRARLNSRFEAHGKLTPVLQLIADLDVFDSRVGEMAASGKIRWRSKGTQTPDVAVDLALDVGQTHARATGTAYDPVHLGKLDIQLALAGNDLSDLFPIVGIPLPPTPAYKLSGHLLHHDDVWTFRQFSGTVGESDLAGDFTVDRARARQSVRAELVSDTLRLVDLGGFIGVKSKPAQKHEKGQPILPNEPFNIEKIRAADVDVHFVGRRVVTQVRSLHRMDTRLRIVRGVVTLDPLIFKMAGGDIVGKVTVDATQPVIAGAANLQIREMRLERLMPKVQNNKASVGLMEGRVQLKGTGNSVAAMLGTSNGAVTVVMNGGEISDLVLRLMNLDVQHTLVTLLRGDQHVPVRCMVGHFEAVHGHLKPQPFILDTENAKVAMTGEIDLGTERLDLKLTAQPKDMSLVSLRGPIVIDGPFDSPSVRPDLKRAIARGAAAIALGIVATPVAALVPLFEVGTAKDANCRAIVTQAKALIDQEPGAQPPVPDTMEAAGSSRKGGG
jgi:uncharacterized protein involved in outer membrane biogenesis